ncbi:hypothetical protein O7626_40955 [Micromonospora sp. WMMD1102]|uniref:hypothetical protein n=1 Tax=Micromonospora sp. WMMD1102 TaxID=3016105 RepID=UPI00241500A2|nr:hypothetical protein [Micromonospora sp. WMMD1102]MDG4785700.1 hypothetical protein [Micromonospora sp. WMMD1102]MDG4792175.1 hypothetical protein [Micromonospora sp. WMMD1102]
MKLFRALLALMVASVVLATGTPASADPAPSGDKAGRQGLLLTGSTAPQCVLTLDRPVPGQDRRAVRSYECLSPGEQRFIPQSSLLMTWYDNVDYYGASTVVEDSWPCDPSGYRIPTGSWVNRITSFKVWNDCYRTTAYVQSDCLGISRGYTGNVPYVGSVMNDRIGCFRTRAA